MEEDVCAISSGHISREAGDKTKGFRFQKLRAAIRFLERVRDSRGKQVQCALEFLEDSVVVGGSGESLISAEENKYYGTGISLNSPTLRNTLTAFLDLYFAFQRSKDLKFGVYASAELAQERLSAEFRKGLGLEAKQKFYSILEQLTLGIELDEEESKVAFAIVRKEYYEAYKGKTTGFKKLLEDMELSEFKAFIESIDWKVTNDTNESLEHAALHLIRTCQYFNYRHKGLESYLLSALLDELEKRSGAETAPGRLISTDTLRIIFNEILFAPVEDRRTEDPAWEGWAGVETADFRNLAQKIQSACPDFSPGLLKALARSCSLARSVPAEEQKEMKALLRRILDVCEVHLLTNCLDSVELTQKQVLDMIDELVILAEHHVATLRGRYRYTLHDAQSIKGAVLTLFDDCYLAFDEVPADE